MIPVTPQGPANPVSEQFPLILNTGRIRDQWHTMTRTGKSAKLSTHISEAYIQIHPQDANKYNIDHENIVNVCSNWGRGYC